MKILEKDKDLMEVKAADELKRSSPAVFCVFGLGLS